MIVLIKSKKLKQLTQLVLDFRSEVLDKFEEIKTMISDSEKAILSQIDTETNDIAAILTALRAQIAAGTLDNKDLDAALQSAADRLKGVAANPASPVPSASSGNPSVGR